MLACDICKYKNKKSCDYCHYSENPKHKTLYNNFHLDDESLETLTTIENANDHIADAVYGVKHDLLYGTSPDDIYVDDYLI